MQMQWEKWSGRGYVAVLNIKGKVNTVTVRNSRVKVAVRFVWLMQSLWHWLVDHDVPRSEIDRKPTKFLPDLYKQKKKILGQLNKSLTWIIKSVLMPWLTPRLESVYRSRTPGIKKGWYPDIQLLIWKMLFSPCLLVKTTRSCLFCS